MAPSTHLLVLLIINLVAGIFYCGGGAHTLDEEQGPIFDVVELQAEMAETVVSDASGPCGDTPPCFPGAHSAGFPVLSYINRAEGDTAMALD